MAQKVLFLDRDGTINVDCGPTYLTKIEDAKLIPGVAAALKAARNAGYKLAIITNQACIAKGICTLADVENVNARLGQMIADELGTTNFHFDDIQICPHHPKEGCACRKPATLMLERSIKKLDAAASESFFMGDKDSDLKIASQMKVRSILLRTGHGVQTESELKDSAAINGHIATLDNLSDAVKFILNGEH